MLVADWNAEQLRSAVPVSSSGTGLVGWLRGLLAPTIEAPLELPLATPHTPHPSRIETLVNQAHATRYAGVGVTSLLGVVFGPAVYRAVELCTDVSALCNPVAWRDGRPLLEQPPLVRSPDPFTRRADFIRESVLGLCSGQLYWRASSWDEWGHPMSLSVIPRGELEPYWGDERRLERSYRWRGSEVTRREIVDIPMIRPAGQLAGLGPLDAIADVAATSGAALVWALGVFTDGAVPSGVLETPFELSADEALKLKTQWLGEHRGHRGPAILSGGTKYSTVSWSISDAQLTALRDSATLDTARAFGIPPFMLAAAVAGSSLTYSNLSQIGVELVRFGILPSFLRRLEDAWSEQLPRGTSVVFDTSAIERGDTTGRYADYETGLRAGFLTVDEVRRSEGLEAVTVEQAAVLGGTSV